MLAISKCFWATKSARGYYFFMNWRRTLLLLLLAVTAAHSENATVQIVDLDQFFEGMEGCFVLQSKQHATRWIYNEKRAAQRFLPASTYKIPHTLIALEIGIADGPNFALPWDSERNPPREYWPRSWRKDQTLKSALQNSVVWFYQELARRIGEPRMQNYLDRFDYGNRTLTGGIDRFWLDGDLRISPLEQIYFLQRFHGEQLGVSPRSTALVKEMLLLEERPGLVLSGKTGTARVTPTREMGWQVGTIETTDDLLFYALNMEGERVWEDWPPHKRKALVLQLFDAVRAPAVTPCAGP